MADPVPLDGWHIMTKKFEDLDHRLWALERPTVSQKERYLERIVELEAQVASLRGANARVAAAFSDAATTDETSTPAEPDEQPTPDE